MNLPFALPTIASGLLAKIASGIAAAALVALVVVCWRADTISGQRDDARLALVAEKLRHDTTRASVERMYAEIEGMMVAAKQRGIELEQARERVQRNRARLERMTKSSDARIERLLALAKNRPADAEVCVVPSELVRELEGM